MALIPCICLGARTERLLCFALFYTGVGYCIVCSCIGLSTTFIQINEMSSTLSVYLPQPFWSWWLFFGCPKCSPNVAKIVVHRERKISQIAV